MPADFTLSDYITDETGVGVAGIAVHPYLKLSGGGTVSLSAAVFTDSNGKWTVPVTGVTALKAANPTWTGYILLEIYNPLTGSPGLNQKRIRHGNVRLQVESIVGADGDAPLAPNSITGAMIQTDALVGTTGDLKIGNRTADVNIASPASSTANLTTWLSWIIKTFKLMKGSTNWYDAPATTLATAATRLGLSFGSVQAGATTISPATDGQQLQLVAGSGVTVTGDNTLKRVTIAASGGGSAGTSFGQVDAGGTLVIPASDGQELNITGSGGITITGNNTTKTVNIDGGGSSGSITSGSVTATGGTVQPGGSSLTIASQSLAAGTYLLIAQATASATVNYLWQLIIQAGSSLGTSQENSADHTSAISFSRLVTLGATTTVNVLATNQTIGSTPDADVFVTGGQFIWIKLA